MGVSKISDLPDYELVRKDIEAYKLAVQTDNATEAAAEAPPETQSTGDENSGEVLQ